MAIVINGSGTVTGLAVGGLPDGTVDSGTLATDSVVTGKIADGTIANADIADLAASKLTGALPAISGASLTSLPVIDCDADAWHYTLTSHQDNSSAAIFDIGTVIKKGSNITESGGVITVGTAGWYLITLDAANAGTDTQSTDTRIRKNGSNLNGTRIYWANAASYAGKSRTILIEASANDTFDVHGTGNWYGEGGSAPMTGWIGVRIGA